MGVFERALALVGLAVAMVTAGAGCSRTFAAVNPRPSVYEEMVAGLEKVQGVKTRTD